MPFFAPRRCRQRAHAFAAPLFVVVAIASLLAPCSTAPALASVPGPASSGTVWLCRPGLVPDPCETARAATVVQATGARSLLPAQTSALASRFDCFYVYPTASREGSYNSNLVVQTPEVDAAIAQASRFTQVCKVYAPMYREVTWHGIEEWFADPSVGATAGRVAYQSILAGFEDYLTHYNRGRPLILIGHSQGSAMLILLMEHLVDDNAALRSRLVLAIIPGGNVQVPTGALVGGSFSHIRLCSTTGQAGCVIAYSTFPGVPPARSVVGRPGRGISAMSGQSARGGVQVACVNPAAIEGGTATLDTFFPVLSSGVVPPSRTSATTPRAVSTPWVEYPGLYRASCERADGASWLQVTKATGPSDHRPLVSEALGPNWGYHEDDVNLALGNLVADAAAAEATWERSTK